MINKILSLSKRLISIPSTKENPLELKKVLRSAENELGKGFTVEKFEKNGVPSLLFYNTPRRPKKFKIILNAHLDVVPAKPEQYIPFEKNGKLFGRGASDMKAAAAVEILVFKEVAKKLNYPIALQLVTDEEIGGNNGTKYQIGRGVKCEFVIAGEPTNFGISTKAKGIVWGKIKVKGVAAHGAYVWRGENALWKAKKILDRIEKAYPVFKKAVWKTTFNLAKIDTSNQTFNKIPDDAVISFDVRYIPEEKKTIVKKLSKLVGREGKMELIETEPPHKADEDSLFIKNLRLASQKVVGKPAPIIIKHGASDIRHFSEVDSPGVTFGLISGGLHTDNEWADIKSLGDYYNVLKVFLLSL